RLVVLPARRPLAGVVAVQPDERRPAEADEDARDLPFGVTSDYLDLGMVAEACGRLAPELLVDLDGHDAARVGQEEIDRVSQVGTGLDERVVTSVAKQSQEMAPLRTKRWDVDDAGVEVPQRQRPLHELARGSRHRAAQPCGDSRDAQAAHASKGFRAVW